VNVNGMEAEMNNVPITPRGMREPPVTQAELDRIEKMLSGELPADTYMPGEGVPVTGPNGQ